MLKSEFLSLSKSATRKKVENLFGDLYQEEIYSGYLSTKREGDETKTKAPPSSSIFPLYTQEPILSIIC